VLLFLPPPAPPSLLSLPLLLLLGRLPVAGAGAVAGQHARNSVKPRCHPRLPSGTREWYASAAAATITTATALLPSPLLLLLPPLLLLLLLLLLMLPLLLVMMMPPLLVAMMMPLSPLLLTLLLMPVAILAFRWD